MLSLSIPGIRWRKLSVLGLLGRCFSSRPETVWYFLGTSPQSIQSNKFWLLTRLIHWSYFGIACSQLHHTRGKILQTCRLVPTWQMACTQRFADQLEKGLLKFSDHNSFSAASVLALCSFSMPLSSSQSTELHTLQD